MSVEDPLARIHQNFINAGLIRRSVGGGVVTSAVPPDTSLQITVDAVQPASATPLGAPDGIVRYAFDPSNGSADVPQQPPRSMPFDPIGSTGPQKTTDDSHSAINDSGFVKASWRAPAEKALEIRRPELYTSGTYWNSAATIIDEPFEGNLDAPMVQGQRQQQLIGSGAQGPYSTMGPMAGVEPSDTIPPQMQAQIAASWVPGVRDPQAVVQRMTQSQLPNMNNVRVEPFDQTAWRGGRDMGFSTNRENTIWSTGY